MRRVVVVTDGDCTALKAVEQAARNVNARCISLTGCRQSEDARWTPEDVEELILSTPRDPVVVLVDDEGFRGEGWGESVLRHLCKSKQIAVAGVVAVASDLHDATGAAVDASITLDGKLVRGVVGKEGRPKNTDGGLLKGDTVENVNDFDIPIVIGIGDPGKMDMADDARKGAPITTKALEVVLNGTSSLNSPSD